jgi:hypothetical protein
LENGKHSLCHNFLYLFDALVLRFGYINDYENGSSEAAHSKDKHRPENTQRSDARREELKQQGEKKQSSIKKT